MLILTLGNYVECVITGIPIKKGIPPKMLAQVFVNKIKVYRWQSQTFFRGKGYFLLKINFNEKYRGPNLLGCKPRIRGLNTNFGSVAKSFRVCDGGSMFLSMFFSMLFTMFLVLYGVFR